ncbi:FAD/NAD(P)-binding protein [Candidatus Pacearchaeota archaeon]|nr:FAD/NAD(P)-binding protein [Candidatus Pacearchaeota archaeon]
MTYEPSEAKIISVKKYAEDVKLFKVKTKINPLPGQFFQLSILGIGECPLASCSYNKKYADVLVKNSGSVTNTLFNLKKGDGVFIRGPYGRGYNFKEIEGKNLVLAAGGTGIAPVASLIDYIEQNRKNFGEIKILFGFKDESFILLGDRIERWKKKFDFTLCLDKYAGKLKYEVGLLPDILKKKKINSENTCGVLCGPEIMMKSATAKLNSVGIKNDKIYWNMERRMECAAGSCGRCLIQDLYTCKDGPVFRYDIIKEKLENESAK